MNDDLLALYYYDDGLRERERRAIGDALARDPALAARYRRLAAELDAWRDPTPLPAPSGLKQRWHDSIDRAALAETRSAGGALPRPFHAAWFLWGAAAAATLAVAVGLYVTTGGDAPGAPAETIVETRPVVAADAVPAAFTRGFAGHLRESRAGLAGLDARGDTERIALVLRIIEQNRLFERAAEHHQAPKLARVLRAFEPILFELAADDIAPEDVEALKAQLAFELKVMLTRLSRDASVDAQSI